MPKMNFPTKEEAHIWIDNPSKDERHMMKSLFQMTTIHCFEKHWMKVCQKQRIFQEDFPREREKGEGNREDNWMFETLEKRGRQHNERGKDILIIFACPCEIFQGRKI